MKQHKAPFPHSITVLQPGRKTAPTSFIDEAWEKVEAKAIWRWSQYKQVSIFFSRPSVHSFYFMAEVSALDQEQEKAPQHVALAINDTIIDSWTIDSKTVHDKFIYIPSHLLGKNENIIHLKLILPEQHHNQNGGMELHTIALHTGLAAYLAELQTGYDWVCSIRNELIDTVRQTLFFLDSIENPPISLISSLQEILDDPYVQSRHEATLIFDKIYFQNKQIYLKEGRIHQAIRQWAHEIKLLHSIIVNAGNYATHQPQIHCWSQEGLCELLGPPVEYDTKIAQLRELNTTLNNLEIILHHHSIESFPPILYLDITNRCNFRCRMCYQSQSNFLRQNLINNHLARIIDQLPHITDITIAGLGEPLLSKNLLHFAERAKALHCNTTIITNGSLISGNIHLLNQFTTVSISFDGSEQTTFEALRKRSNFAQIISNIKKLRNEAPDISIAFSVVASRVNIDELVGIMQKAADIGVNIVNITPLEHMPIFELKESDFHIFQEQINKAKQIAEQAQITLTVAVNPSNFSHTDDTPRDKKMLIAQLDALATPTETNPTIEEIHQSLQSTKFNYYPDPIVFMSTKWPDLNHSSIRHNPQLVISSRESTFDLDNELSRLKDKINQCLLEIRAVSLRPLRIPYCLAPWKFNYIKNNGKLRLCCHTDVIVGGLEDNDFNSAVNSNKYQQIRISMNDRHGMLPACRACHAADRALGLESVIATCKEYGIPVDTSQLAYSLPTDFSKSHLL